MPRGSALQRKVYIAEPLSEAIGSGPMPRAHITKKIWEYIKKHRLQDPTNKRMIRPDELFAECFGRRPFSMFELTKKIQKFVIKEDEYEEEEYDDDDDDDYEEDED